LNALEGAQETPWWKVVVSRPVGLTYTAAYRHVSHRSLLLLLLLLLLRLRLSHQHRSLLLLLHLRLACVVIFISFSRCVDFVFFLFFLFTPSCLRFPSSICRLP
jgi:hypothetical protein